MFTILGAEKVLFICEHLTMEQIGTFMARNGEIVGNVMVVNEDDPEHDRKPYYDKKNPFRKVVTA